MTIRGPTNSYVKGELVAETDVYRLYLCQQEGTDRQCLLQVAKDVAQNSILTRFAYILERLISYAEELEAEYAKVKKDPKEMLNYRLNFPELVETFVFAEQGGRQINILAFREVDEISRMVPLTNITRKDHLRVDLRTSGWIMGKLLKLLKFAHSQGFTVKLDGSNILIEPDEHYVLIFDWAGIEIFADETVPDEVVREQISQAAEAVVAVLGADPVAGEFPNDGEPYFDQYTAHLMHLVREGESSADTAHREFYELIDGLWPREFYQFKTHPLNGGERS